MGTAIVEPQNPEVETPVTPTPNPAPVLGWKDNLPSDMRASPLLQSYDNTPDGMAKAFNGYLSLEKLLGREKIVVPKDDNDTEGWNMFNKAMGVPDKPEGYGLEDSALPENMKDYSLDKQEFAQAMMEARIPKSSVNKLWKVYQQKNIDTFNKLIQQNQEKMNKNINTLKSEWGEAYNINVELGQQVINRFATNKEESDWLTAVLLSDPIGIRFLARTGDQFAENKVPEFQVKKFTMSPESAQEEITKLKADFNGPYWNHANKFTEREQRAAQDRVNMLYGVIQRAGKA